MAFMRKVEVVVGPKGGEGFKIDGLKITFTIAEFFLKCEFYGEKTS
jgi:hypothetical protein